MQTALPASYLHRFVDSTVCRLQPYASRPTRRRMNLYTPVVGQLGTVETLTVLGHVYVAGYVAFGYGLEEDGISIASITVTDSVDIMMNLDPDGDGIFGAPHHVLAAPLRMRATPGNPTRHHRPTL